VYEAPAGITIINEGENGDFMMLLIKGMVDVLRRNRYNYPSRIAVAHSGHALGEMSMFDGEPRFASCVTLENSRIAVLTRDALLLVLSDEPKLGNKILLKLVQLLSERLRQTSAKLVSYLEAARDV
jgi:CRP/FNR family transcriptional regulator, cyclic AMP receptor protein